MSIICQSLNENYHNFFNKKKLKRHSAHIQFLDKSSINLSFLFFSIGRVLINSLYNLTIVIADSSVRQRPTILKANAIGYLKLQNNNLVIIIFLKRKFNINYLPKFCWYIPFI